MLGNVLVPTGRAAEINIMSIEFQMDGIAPWKISVTKRIFDHDIINLPASRIGNLFLRPGVGKHPSSH